MEKIPDFYSIKKFAEKLNIHPNTVRKAINAGRIVAFRVSDAKHSMYRIPHSEIERIARFDLSEKIKPFINIL